MSDVFVRPASNHDVVCIILLANQQKEETQRVPVASALRLDYRPDARYFSFVIQPPEGGTLPSDTLHKFTLAQKDHHYGMLADIADDQTHSTILISAGRVNARSRHASHKAQKRLGA